MLSTARKARAKPVHCQSFDLFPCDKLPGGLIPHCNYSNRQAVTRYALTATYARLFNDTSHRLSPIFQKNPSRPRLYLTEHFINVGGWKPVSRGIGYGSAELNLYYGPLDDHSSPYGGLGEPTPRRSFAVGAQCPLSLGIPRHRGEREVVSAYWKCTPLAFTGVARHGTELNLYFPSSRRDALHCAGTRVSCIVQGASSRH